MGMGQHRSLTVTNVPFWWECWKGGFECVGSGHLWEIPVLFSQFCSSPHKGSNNKVYILCACFRCIQLFVTPWTVACQAPLSMRFSRQESWSGLPFLLQGIFPTQGSKLGLLHWQVGSSPLSQLENPKPKHYWLQTCLLIQQIAGRRHSFLQKIKIKKINSLVNQVIAWTLHSWKQGDFSCNTHRKLTQAMKK